MSSSPPPDPDRSGAGSNPEPLPEPGRPPRVHGAATPLSDPLVPPDLRGWLDRVIEVVRRSLVPLLTLQVGVAALGAVLTYLADVALPDPTRPGGFGGFAVMLGMLVAFAAGMLVQGASVYVVIRDAAGHQATATEGLRFAAGRASGLIGWGLAAALLTGLGFLLIVPGIYLAIVFGAALAGVLTVERAGISRCLELVHRRFWPTAGRIVPAAAVGAFYSLVVSPYLVSALSEPRSLSAAALQAALGIPMGMVSVGVAVVSYAELRFHERGEVFTATLADEIAR
ncbi:hypothetical protein [Pseudonocardia acaciae]|uniref:hypothetical protein n=1 Tax=Pseudonocardia acaciae TaxID=551276 RepID=UPI00048EFDA9|nr:hypothetical protein [Pseudonocardia acaciae]